MTATPTRPRRKAAQKPANTPARPVSELLLELAYQMHATKVVGYRTPPAK